MKIIWYWLNIMIMSLHFWRVTGHCHVTVGEEPLVLLQYYCIILGSHHLLTKIHWSCLARLVVGLLHLISVVLPMLLSSSSFRVCVFLEESEALVDENPKHCSFWESSMLFLWLYFFFFNISVVNMSGRPNHMIVLVCLNLYRSLEIMFEHGLISNRIESSTEL